MSNPLQQTIEALAKEKGIEPDVVISAIEEAVATASRKYYKTGENLKTRFNMETGQVDLFALKTVVQQVETPATEIAIDEARQMYQQLYGDDVANSIELGDEMEFPKPTEVLGRIAAQTAKQVIFQKVREAEREHVFAEYNERVGEVVNGTVKRFENGDIILEIGRIEAVLPRKEQSRAESYTPADRVRTVIKGVNRSAKGPQIVLSRTDPALLIKLFEQEVPEIYDGTVLIRGAVREAGDRAKVAVMSRERDVDPVGACVGMKGTRVQSIIRELRGEKIDIVEWSEDAIAFVTNALSPAKVQRVSIVDDGGRVMEVIVEDKQLSLAIGKKGQNVRLAAKLTGWRIDIKSEEEKRREVEAQFEGLEGAIEPADGETAEAGSEAPAGDTAEGAAPADGTVEAAPYELAGIGEKLIRKLAEAGYGTIATVATATVEQLSEIPGIGGKTAEKILAAARGESEPAPAEEPAETSQQ
ncbi:MAG TPA: transcription termination factor NusA [Vicinamibacterales bacterium]|jgi:N utilization substance protein A|nr:transcription termination factor NusA [Vicinamibacterales bacterium]